MNQVQAAGQVALISVEQPIGEYRIPMTDVEFQESFDDGRLAEWVNGEAIVYAPPNLRHQRIVNYLHTLLGIYLGAFGLGELFLARLAMRLSAEGSIREPDLLFVANEHATYVGEQRLNGPADLVIEIISTESVGCDRGNKFYEYQAGGVREYWVIDPRPGLARADFWVLDETNRFHPIPIDSDDNYHSTVLPDFRLDVNQLLSDPLPDPLKVAGELMGNDVISRAFGFDH